MAQFFLERLWILLVLADRPYLCLAAERSGKGITVGLAVSGAKSLEGEVVVGLSRFSL